MQLVSLFLGLYIWFLLVMRFPLVPVNVIGERYYQTQITNLDIIWKFRQACSKENYKELNMYDILRRSDWKHILLTRM